MIGAMLMRRRLPQLFAAMRRKDLEAVCRGIRDDSVFEFPGHSTISGRYEGRQAIEGFWRRVFQRYETFDIRPLRIALHHPYALGATNVALVEWTEQGVTHDGVSATAHGVTVIEIQRGKLVRARDYFFDPGTLDPVWGRQGEHIPHGRQGS